MTQKARVTTKPMGNRSISLEQDSTFSQYLDVQIYHDSNLVDIDSDRNTIHLTVAEARILAQAILDETEGLEGNP